MNGQAAAPAPRVTILIVTWNAWRHLRPCLDSLRMQDFHDFETVVIDNASADGSADLVERSYPWVRLIPNAENIGHTRAVNQGFRAARGEMIVVLDADTESAPGSLRTMVRFMDEHPEVDVIAPRIYNDDGTVQESARNLPGALNGLFGRQSLLTRLFPRNPISRKYLRSDMLETNEPFRVESVASTCMLLRRSLIDRVGAWDEGYPGYFVETDWCYRLQCAGIKVFCVPEAHVSHHEMNKRTRKRSPRRIWMFHQGAFRFYRTNRTMGWLDPRAWLAAAALSMRAGILVALNAFKEDAAHPPKVPAPEQSRNACREER